MKRLIWPVAFTLLCILAASAGGENEQWEEVFFRANQAYKEGRFQEAVDGYLQLIKSGHGEGHIYYNLGNGYVRLNELGEAILNYERARLMLPRDADLDFNLRYARDQIQDVLPQSSDFVSMSFFWLGSLNFDEVFWSFAVFNAVFWGILLLRIFYRSEWSYYLLLVSLVLWLISGASLGLKWYQIERDDRAVVLQKEVNVLAGPDSGDTVLFKLHEGSIVHSERSEDGWSLIRLQDGKRGWLKAEAIERIILKTE
jgi:tetratricopeptide (TPR) repeat protein